MRFLFCEQVSETHLRGDTLDDSLSLSLSIDYLPDVSLFTSSRDFRLVLSLT